MAKCSKCGKDILVYYGTDESPLCSDCHFDDDTLTDEEKEIHRKKFRKSNIKGLFVFVFVFLIVFAIVFYQFADDFEPINVKRTLVVSKGEVAYVQLPFKNDRNYILNVNVTEGGAVDMYLMDNGGGRDLQEWFSKEEKNYDDWIKWIRIYPGISKEDARSFYSKGICYKYPYTDDIHYMDFVIVNEYGNYTANVEIEWKLY